MYMGTFQKKALEKFIASQRILILIYYVLSMRLLYYLLLEFFLERIIIVENYKKIMILNIHLKKLKNEKGRDRKRKTSEKKDLNIITIAKKQKISSLADISTAINR